MEDTLLIESTKGQQILSKMTNHIENDYEQVQEERDKEKKNQRIRLSRTHKCKKCEQSFKTACSLNQHKKRIHFHLHACDYCFATFLRKYALECHLKTHMDPLTRPTFKCDNCERRFATKSNLTRHVRLHHNKDKPVYKCSYCGRIYFSETDLQHHKKEEAHDREKCVKVGNISPENEEWHRPFFCKVLGCEKNFKKKGNLKRHVEQVHLNLITYHCSRCGTTVKRRSNVKRHSNRHHDRDEQRVYDRRHKDQQHIADTVNQEVVENAVITTGTQMEEDEFRAFSETAEALISQLVTNEGYNL